MIDPLTIPNMETFNIDEAMIGAAFTGALLVSAFLYPICWYLYDRYLGVGELRVNFSLPTT
jgi:hypothetical protein